MVLWLCVGTAFLRTTGALQTRQPSRRPGAEADAMASMVLQVFAEIGAVAFLRRRWDAH